MYSDRITALRGLMQKNNADYLLLVSKENIYYYSGFTAGEDAYIFITPEKEYVFTDFRYKEQAKIQTDGYEIIITKKSLNDGFSEYINSQRIRKIYFEPSIKYVIHDKLIKMLENTQTMPLYDAADIPRAIKDDREIGYIKKACEIADSAYLKVLDQIKPGISERELAALLEYEMKKRGASGASFDTTIASGKRSSLPHGNASDKIIEYGDIITFDFGARYMGYCSDTTRTVFLGRITDEQRRVYGIVYDSQMAALSFIKANQSNYLADKTARDIIKKNGYGNNFGHGLGHGLGLLVHEMPRLSSQVDEDETLKKGMVVTVEPGIYIEDSFGVRIEDTVLVTDEGVDIFTKTKKEIIIL